MVAEEPAVGVAQSGATEASAGGRPTHGRTRRLVGLVGLVIVATLAGLMAMAVAPFLIREAPSSGAVFDQAAPLSGQGQEATQALRAWGYTCADSDATEDVVTRVCTRVKGAASSRVQLIVVADGGAIELARTTVEESTGGGRDHSDVVVALARTVGLAPAEQRAIVEVAMARSGAPLRFGWGSFTPPSESDPSSELRAAAWDRPAPGPSTMTFAASLDALAAAATARGYACVTPTVDTIRSCTRSADGYGYDLWLQGTSTYVTSVELSVTASFRTHTRSHWVEEMLIVLGGVDTAQSRALTSWLQRSADAPGADTYVDGVPISIRSRPEQGTKETFGGILAECGRMVDDISACAP